MTFMDMVMATVTRILLPLIGFVSIGFIITMIISYFIGFNKVGNFINKYFM